MAEEQALDSPTQQREHPEAKPVDFPPVEDKSMDSAPRSVQTLGDVTVTLTAELGVSMMFVKEILGLRVNSVVELDKLAGELIDIHLNDVFFAKGEVVVIGDALGVRLTEIAGQEEAKQDADRSV
jgi:flagellar motor switch protein FliN/FliY